MLQGKIKQILNFAFVRGQNLEFEKNGHVWAAQLPTSSELKKFDPH